METDIFLADAFNENISNFFTKTKQDPWDLLKQLVTIGYGQALFLSEMMEGEQSPLTEKLKNFTIETYDELYFNVSELKKGFNEADLRNVNNWSLVLPALSRLEFTFVEGIISNAKLFKGKKWR